MGFKISKTSVIGFEGDTGQSMKINLMFSIETKDGNLAVCLNLLDKNERCWKLLD